MRVRDRLVSTLSSTLFRFGPMEKDQVEVRVSQENKVVT